MNKSRVLMSTATVLVIGVFAAQAADNPGQQRTTGGAQQRTAGVQQQQSGQSLSALQKASQLIDAKVHSSDKQEFGTVQDIVLDQDLQKASYLVVSKGSGAGSQQCAVPLQAIDVQGSGKDVTIKLSKADLDGAPTLKSGWPSQGDTELSQSEEYFGQKSEQLRGIFDEDTPGARRPATPQAGRTPTPATAQAGRPAQGSPEQVRWARKVSNLMGTDAKNNEDKSIGELSDIILSTDDGRLAFALLKIQGVEGLDNQMAACPWSAVDLQSQQRVAKVDVSTATLRSVAFESGNAPDFSNQRYAENIYRQFNEEPYWTTYGFEGEDPGTERPQIELREEQQRRQIRQPQQQNEQRKQQQPY